MNADECSNECLSVQGTVAFPESKPTTTGLLVKYVECIVYLPLKHCIDCCEAFDVK